MGTSLRQIAVVFAGEGGGEVQEKQLQRGSCPREGPRLELARCLEYLQVCSGTGAAMPLPRAAISSSSTRRKNAEWRKIYFSLFFFFSFRMIKKEEFVNSLELQINSCKLKTKISLTQPHRATNASHPLWDLQLYQHCPNTNVSSSTPACLAPYFCAPLCLFKSRLIFSPLSLCDVFINRRSFLLFFLSVFILDLILIYLLSFSLLLMVLLLNVQYHQRLNTSVYDRCPSGFSRLAFTSCNEILYFWRPVLAPGNWWKSHYWFQRDRTNH